MATWQPYVVGFAMAGVFFTVALVFQQTNLRRLLAFAVVSHTSLLVIGLFSLHEAGIQGGAALANFGLAVTGMWFIVGLFSGGPGSRNWALSGLFERIPFSPSPSCPLVWRLSACQGRPVSMRPT